jgi:hypothetical protein
LQTAQVATLTTDQIVALETIDITALTTDSIVALTSDQTAALTTDQIGALKTSQIGALETRDAAALTTDQIIALNSAQIGALKTAQVAALTTDQVAAIETADITALTTAGIAALTTAGVAALTTDQIGALKTGQIGALETRDAAVLTTDQIIALTSTQISVLNSNQVNALSTTQFAAIGTTNISALSTNAIAALTSTHIAALTTDEINSLAPNQLSAFRSALVAVTCSAQTNFVSALSTSQIMILTTTQISQILSTPLILDLNGDGVNTLSISSGTQFDLFAIGEKVHTGWVSSSDGLLSLDRNHDGKINDGSELFGSSTTLANGQKANDGYAALRELDSNGDNSITTADAQWASLKVWVDKNSDGISEDGEMFALDSLNITKLYLHTQSTAINNNGNVIGLTSSYQTNNGVNHDMADVWFVAEKPQNLQNQVSNLAQAISSYGAEGSTDRSTTNRLTDSQTQPADQSIAVSVGGIVSKLNQFNANGNLIPNTVQTSSTPNVIGQSLVTNTQDPAKIGFLAS